jgi:hypothetical protein
VWSWISETIVQSQPLIETIKGTFPICVRNSTAHKRWLFVLLRGSMQLLNPMQNTTIHNVSITCLRFTNDASKFNTVTTETLDDRSGKSWNVIFRG